MQRLIAVLTRSKIEQFILARLTTAQPLRVGIHRDTRRDHDPFVSHPLR
jgi:hypothetical protein